MCYRAEHAGQEARVRRRLDLLRAQLRVPRCRVSPRLPRTMAGLCPWASAPPGSGSVAKSVAGPRQKSKTSCKTCTTSCARGFRSSPTYTVQDAVDDWLTHGLQGRSAKTISTNREVLPPLTALIGAAKLRELTAADVGSALAELATTRSTRTVQIAHDGLVRAIHHAEANDLVGRNVATLVATPKGLEGRPSKSLTLPQAQALIKAAEAARLHAYIVLSLLTGCRTEEARALRWDHVDLEGDPDAEPPVPPYVAVWRSVRSHSDVKTRKSRRTLRLPVAVVDALKTHKARKTGCSLEPCGGTTGWYSPRLLALRSIHPMSGAASEGLCGGWDR